MGAARRCRGVAVAAPGHVRGLVAHGRSGGLADCRQCAALLGHTEYVPTDIYLDVYFDQRSGACNDTNNNTDNYSIALA